MKKVILFFCVLNMLSMHEGRANDSIDHKKDCVIIIQHEVHNAGEHLDAYILPRWTSNQTPEISNCAKITYGLVIGIPMVCGAIYLGIH
jgi:hypothetical protein